MQAISMRRSIWLPWTRPFNAAFLKKMREGVELKELDVTTRPCKVEAAGAKTFRIILTQGLNRQIRRMCGNWATV